MRLFRADAHIQLSSFSQHHGLVKLERLDCIPIRLVPDIATLPIRYILRLAPVPISLRSYGIFDVRGLTTCGACGLEKGETPGW